MPYYVLDDISRTKGVTRKCPVHFQVTQGVLLDCVMTNFKPLFSVNDMPVISPLSRYLATGQRERLNSCLSKGQDCKRNVQCLTNSVFLSSNRDAPNTHHPPSHIGKKKNKEFGRWTSQRKNKISVQEPEEKKKQQHWNDMQQNS